MNEKPQELAPEAEAHQPSLEDGAAEATMPEDGADCLCRDCLRKAAARPVS